MGDVMEITYNAYEIFEIADKVEETGEAFYRSAASVIVDNDDVKALLNELADMEASHKNYFRSIRDRLNVKSEDGLLDLDDQAAGYLKTIGEAHAVHNLATIMNETTPSAKEVLEVALDFEKDTVVYFAALKAAIVNEDDKTKIQSIVEEEIEHVAILTKKLKEV